MPRVEPYDAPYPNAVVGWTGAIWRCLSVDAAGQLQVDVIASGLPLGAATAGNQTLVITSLLVIEQLYNALQSVNTDALQVRGEDQLFSFQEVLLDTGPGIISGNDGEWHATTVPPGEVWKMCNIRAVDVTTATTSHQYCVFRAPVGHWFEMDIAARAAGISSFWHGEIWLGPGDILQVWFVGGLAGDTCWLTIMGWKMTLEV